MDSRRKSSPRARRSSIDNEEVEAFDMSGMTERQIRQARRAQRSSLIQGGSSSRSTMQREEVARGKRVVEAEEEHHEEAPFEEAVSEEEVEIIGDDTPTPELKFEGTRYPHKETMQELGICGDVEYLMELANLATFMSCQCGGYKEESCQLFATLKVHFCLGEDSRHVQKGLKRTLLDPFTRSRQLEKRHQFTRPLYSIEAAKEEDAIDILAPPTRSSTRPVYSTKGEEEASTRPIDHSEHRHKGADFAAPSLLDPQDRVFAQTASSLLPTSESRVSTFYYK
uniref:Uncharacterized protein F3A14.7 n=1 Tax=Arabidopsis thaliana TaxID=3702 RepID=Q9FWA7_ARATH|nr:unknown protein; 17672-20388 [Arabidopsis thaliana]